jgi:hypothetical protein
MLFTTSKRSDLDIVRERCELMDRERSDFKLIVNSGVKCVALQ